MKKIYLLLLTVFATTIVAFSQVPAGFNYQAVVRNSSGEIIANKTVSFRITILKGAGETKQTVYAETHSVKTNAFGLVTIMVGTGTKIRGTFTASGWGSDPHFLKVEIDAAGGNSFSFLSTTQLMAVPYAFHAQTVENDSVDDDDHDITNEIQTLSLSNNQLSLSKSGGSVTLPTSGGSSLWSKTGDNIFYNSGRVAIGEDPGAGAFGRKLQVTEGDGMALGLENNSSYATLYVKNHSGGQAAWFLGSLTIDNGNVVEGDVLTSTNDHGYAIWSAPAWKKAANGLDIYTLGTGVGIGTDNPGFSLDISSTNADANINVKTTSGNAYMLIDRPNNGQAADIAFKTNGVLKFMAGFLPGSDNYRISSKYSSLKGLEVEPDGDVNITKELHSAATGQANMVPVAFGYVNANGSIYKAKSTPNFTGVTKTGTGRYDLTISGIKYNGTSYNVFVTNTTTEPRVFSVGYNPATYNIYVFAYDLNGNLVDSHFSFIVYKGNGN